MLHYLYFTLYVIIQKSTASRSDTFSADVARNGQEVSIGDGTVRAEYRRPESVETSHVPLESSTAIDCVDEVDLNDSSCIPDTQLAQSSRVACLPSSVSSPDVEMIPDTPDSESSIRGRKTFQRSYLSSRSNLLGAGDGYRRRKTSPPLPRKMSKSKCQNRKQISVECADLSVHNDYSSLADFSPNYPVSVAAAHVHYPVCDIINKRCATDPLPLSKRCDQKVTPTKPLVSSTNPDVVYGTVPSRLFQEALSREKLASSPRLNKENSPPNASDLDGDEVLLEVLSELKVDPWKRESAQNVAAAGNVQTEDSIVCEDSVDGFCEDNIDGFCNNIKTADECHVNLCNDDDLEDILGELRQQSDVRYSVPCSVVNNNESSFSVKDVDHSPSSQSSNRPCRAAFVNVKAERALIVADTCAADCEAKDYIEQEKSNSISGIADDGVSIVCDVSPVDEVPVSCQHPDLNDTNDTHPARDTSVLSMSDQNVRYLSEFRLLYSAVLSI